MPEKNADLPGVEGEGVSQKKIKAIDDALDNLLGHREKRMAHAEKEADCLAVAVELFHKHNLKVYSYDGKKYQLAVMEKIKRMPEPKDDE